VSLSLILAFAGRHWKLFGIGALVLLLTVQSARLSHAKADLKAERDAHATAKRAWAAELTQCQANRATLDASLKRQSEAVAALKAESARVTAEAEKAAQRAAQAGREAGRIATGVLNAQAGKDRCASALAILKGEAG